MHSSNDPISNIFTSFITGTGCIKNDITNVTDTSVTFILSKPRIRLRQVNESNKFVLALTGRYSAL